ncbi:hypothetical protein [Nocardia pseudovaccinii]|uniref:hypothetical protein n=1 Tax=Nocardia pseudovaccinii TaxID=189540 RepID=UPI0007A53F25|nr:hypothetical protein [Nocardia pseudovaccinii]
MTTATPPAAAADGRAILVTATGSRTPSGRSLTGPVDAIDKLGVLAEWAWKHRALAPLGDPSQPGRRGQLVPQIWFVGAEACQWLGWNVAVSDDAGCLPEVQRRNMIRDELARVVAASLAPLIGAGWTVHGGGDRIRITRTVESSGIDVELVIAATIGGVDTCPAATALTGLDDDAAAAELGRILGAWWTRFKVLPTGTGTGTGAAVLDRISADRLARKQGLVATESGQVPDEVRAGLITEVQPRWARIVEADDIDVPDAEYLVELDQDCGPLASAGMLTLPVGTPELRTGDHARELAAARKRPFAAWQLTLPALAGLDLPAHLPPPDPRMLPDTDVRVWVTTPGLDGLLAPVAHGGLGLDIDELKVTAVVTWDKQGRVLDKWAAALREGLDEFTAAGDGALVAIATDAWRDYLAHQADPRPWQSEALAHHLQPVWFAANCELTRFRGRRAMLRISREFRIAPLAAEGTTLVYAVGADQDICDPPGNRGRHEQRRRAHLATDDDIMALFRPQSAADVADAIDLALGKPVPPRPAVGEEVGSFDNTDDGSTPADLDEASGTDEPALPVRGVPPHEPGVAPSTTESVVAPKNPARRPAPGKKPTPDARFTGPAAVVDVTGAWLADGTCVDLPQDLTHAGDLVEFARTLRLGFPLSPTFVESGQIWITDALARTFGIDVDNIGHRTRNDDLRKLTANLPFVTLAVAAGWQFGGQRDDEEPGVGSWTRVWRTDDDSPTIWLVFLAGMVDDPDAEDPDMPILTGDPEPVVLARRLQLFADTLGFPWKVSGPTTGLDLIKEARPKTYGPTEWREKIWAPSVFDPPRGVGVLARDFTWTRKPSPAEAACKYCHAYDRGGSYTAGLAGLELPIGDPVHMAEGEWSFDATVPAYIRTRIPPSANWLLPYVLSPGGTDFGDEPQWVCTPQFERALLLGYELPVLEAWIWPEHHRALRKWAERFSHAATVLDTADPGDQAVRKQIKVARVRGYGMLASKQLVGDDGPRSPYSPEKWFMGVSKSTANIAHFLNTMYELTGVAALAIDKDAFVIASDDPDPVTAWPMREIDAAAVADNPRHRLSFGRGFGQWKPEASGLMAEQLEYLTGGPYKGKRLLTRYAEWQTQLVA